MKRCDICGGEHFEESLSCEACHKVVSKYQNKPKYPMAEVRKALRGAYYSKSEEKKESGFKCAYTGIIGKFNIQDGTLRTFNDALVLTLDHKNPNSNSKELVVSLNIINKMKTDIPFGDFKKVVITLGEYFNEENDRNSEKFEKELKQMVDKEILVDAPEFHSRGGMAGALQCKP